MNRLKDNIFKILICFIIAIFGLLLKLSTVNKPNETLSAQEHSTPHTYMPNKKM